MRFRMVVPLLLALCAPQLALATKVIVPDQYATIQAGINSNADTVYVRDGDYPEALTIRNGLQLLALPTTGIGGPFLAMPRVKSIGGTFSLSQPRILNFRFSDPVIIRDESGIYIEGCWFGSGLTLTGGGGSTGHIWNCIVTGAGGLALGHSMIEVAMTTVIGGTVDADPPSGRSIHDSAVIGSSSPGNGIFCHSDFSAIRNYVRGYVTGIRADRENCAVSNNQIEDCTGAGIQADRAIYESQPISGNTISRTGRGISLTSDLGYFFGCGIVGGNTIKSPLAEGIYSRAGGNTGSLLNNTILSPGGRGIDVSASFNAIQGNRVLDAGAEGLVLVRPNANNTRMIVTGNVVGHAHARGIVSTGGGSFRNNSSYANELTGYDLAGAETDSVDHNIAFANGGAGLNWSGAAPVMGCNDWYANVGPATSGVAPAASDVALDPLFCNYQIDDVGLQAGSPLAALAGCGQVGALGVGCVVTAVGPGSTPGSAAFALAVTPTPSSGVVRFGWGATSTGGEIAVFDVAGQRRWTRKLDAAQGELTWAIKGTDGRALAPGVYFARLTAGGRSTTQRVVLVP